MTYVVCNGCGAKTKGQNIGGGLILDLHLCPTYTEKTKRITELEDVLLSLKGYGTCWCEISIGNPMMKDHSIECKAAQNAMRKES